METSPLHAEEVVIRARCTAASKKLMAPAEGERNDEFVRLISIWRQRQCNRIRGICCASFTSQFRWTTLDYGHLNVSYLAVAGFAATDIEKERRRDRWSQKIRVAFEQVLLWARISTMFHPKLQATERPATWLSVSQTVDHVCALFVAVNIRICRLPFIHHIESAKKVSD